MVIRIGLHNGGMVINGVFECHPHLQATIGYLGEHIPFAI
jgi:hypothetical protein